MEYISVYVVQCINVSFDLYLEFSLYHSFSLYLDFLDSKSCITYTRFYINQHSLLDISFVSYQLALVCCNIIACILVHVQPGSKAQWSDTGDVFSYRSDTGDVD